MSSKRAAHEGNKELLFEILRILAKHQGLNPERLGGILEKKSYRSPAAKLWYMERRGYIKKTANTYAITQLGKHVLSERQLWELSIPIPKRWDGKLHLVLFDIPVDKQARRDIFRLHLKSLGFLHYQNSVWVHPYPCEAQVRAISDFYRLSNCVSFALLDKITGEKRILQHFYLP